MITRKCLRVTLHVLHCAVLHLYYFIFTIYYPSCYHCPTEHTRMRCIRTYVQAYRTYVHTYIYIYIHTRSYIHTYIHTYIHANIHTFIRMYERTNELLYVCMYVGSSTCLHEQQLNCTTNLKHVTYVRPKDLHTGQHRLYIRTGNRSFAASAT